jgi:type I restriction enzyme M protein
MQDASGSGPGPEDSANLPEPDVIAAEIAEDLQAALDQFAQIAAGLKR